MGGFCFFLLFLAPLILLIICLLACYSKEDEDQGHTTTPQMSTRSENTISRAEQSPVLGTIPRPFLNQSPLSVIQLLGSYEVRGHQTALDRRDNPYYSASAPSYEYPSVTQPHNDQTTVASLNFELRLTK